MSTRVIRYRTHPEHADENQKLVEDVFAELTERQPDGLRYACVRTDDGVFMHVVTLDDDVTPHPLTGLASFARFQAGIGERCLEQPVPTDVTVVGSYRLDLIG
jgi:hypothetical protein